MTAILSWPQCVESTANFKISVQVQCNAVFYLHSLHVDFTNKLQNSLLRHQIETLSALLALCEGNPPVTGAPHHKDQCRGPLEFSLMCAWINGLANNRDAGHLRRHSAHFDVTVMLPLWEISPWSFTGFWQCNRIDDTRSVLVLCFCFITYLSQISLMKVSCNIQSSAVTTWSNIIRYCIHHCSNWDRI